MAHDNPYDPATPQALQAKARITGHVALEPAGSVTTALSGAHVSIPGTSMAADTDASGAFAISGVPAGTWSLQAVRPGWVDGYLTGIAVTLAEGGHDVPVPTITLGVARGSVLGRVTFADGMGHSDVPLAGASVSLAGRPGAVSSDAAGQFLISGVPVGTYTLQVTREGFQEGLSSSFTVLQGLVAEAPDLPMTWDPGGVTGLVVVQGAPDGGGVTVRVRGVTVAGTPFEATTTSASDGHFGLVGLVPAGTYNVSYELRDYGTAGATAMVAAGATTDLPAVGLVRDTGGVMGSATLEGSGNSSGTQVTLTPLPTAGNPTPAVAGAAITDASGSWRVEGLAVGSYRLAYLPPAGYLAPASATVVIVSSGVVVADPVVASVSPGVLRGTALLEGGSAGGYAGTLVQVEGTTLSTHTVADGSWTITRVGTGPQVVNFSAGGFDTQRVQVVTAPGGDLTLAQVTLAVSRGAIQGVFTLSGMAASAGVVVSATGPGSGSAVTSGSGAFTLTGLPVGSYAVTARLDPDWQPATVTGVVVTAGATATVAGSPITLAPIATASVAGTALLEGASDQSGTLVTLAGADFRGVAVGPTTFTTGATGAWSFSALRAGSYQVTFSKAQYEAPSPISASVQTGQAVAAGTVNLATSRGSIGGTFALAGLSSAAGVVVTATGGGGTFTTVAGSTGVVTISGLPVGTYSVTARLDPDWQPSTTPGLVVARNTTTPVSGATITLSPVSTTSISGFALLEGGADPRTISVSLTGTDFRGQAFSTSTSPTTLAGAYTFTGLVGGSYQVAFSRAGYDPAAAPGASISSGQAASMGSVTLPISRGAIQGVFTLSGMAASAGVVVSATGPGSGSAVTSGSGAFTLSGLPVGSYAVTARRDPDWQPATVTGVVVSAGGITTVPGSPLSLQPINTGSIAGKALLQRPVDASGTTVTVSGVDLRGAAVNRTAGTATTGDWSVTGLLAGSYQVTYSHGSYDPPSPAGASLASGQAVSVGTVTLLVSRGSIAGTVSLSAGAVTGFQVGTDRSGVVVTLSGADVPVPPAVTDSGGNYRFDGVPVSLAGGSYGVAAQRTNYLSAATTVTALAGATATAPGLTLNVNAGNLGGTVQLWDNVANGGANASSAGATVSATGVAFNGAAWSAAGSSAANGTFNLTNLPPGSYDLLVTSTGRSCAALARTAVPEGTAAAAGTSRCTDALPPTGVTLGAPPAYVATTSVAVPISAAATDSTVPVSNFRGYQLAVGAAPDWTSAMLVAGQPASLSFTGLPRNARSVLWARAVDWTGNAGPASSVEVVEDDLAPVAPVISTPRSVVNATTTSVTLSGSEVDANFSGYETCTFSQAATVACAVAAPGTCTWGATSPSFALSLPANQKSCLYARAYDLAGNRSAVASLGVGGVVSDLTAPTPPGFVPSFDPVLLTVRAPWVDFFLDTASTDLPAGSGAWSQVAWIEVDSGAGYEPLCPADACHAGGTYAPCSVACGCADARLRCNGTQFTGVRVPLLEGSANTVGFRAVDLAGNVGSGVSQQVRADSTGDVLGGTVTIDGNPQIRGNLVTYDTWTPGGISGVVILDLGADHRGQGTDTRCALPVSVATGYSRGIVPVSPTLVLMASGGSGMMIRPGTGSLFCAADAVLSTFRTPPVNYIVRGVSGAGEVGGWWEDYYSAAIANFYVRQPVTGGQFGAGTDVITLLGSFNYGQSLTVSDRAALVHYANCGVACYQYSNFRWRVYNANTSGGYSSGVTFVDLPATANQVGMSQDGRTLAWVEAGPTLKVRTSGANGVFDAVDDATASMTIPAAWGILNPGAGMDDSVVSVDGTHVVMLGTTPSLGWVVHWWAGQDGVFGTADDTIEQVHPTAGRWGIVSLASSYAVFEEASDIRAIDLSTMRWEVAPQTGLAGSKELAADGRGHLIYRTGDYVLHGRTPDGIESAGPAGMYGSFDALGTNLVTAESNLLVLRTPDAGGNWFTAAAPAPVTLFAGTGSQYVSVSLGGGKGIATEYMPPAAYRYRILEPKAGTLATLPTTGAVVDALGVDQGFTGAAGITARQAFYTCNGINSDLCVRNAGADGYFGTGDDTTSPMAHPTGSPRAGNLVHDARAFQVSGTRMLLAEFSPPALYLFDAGPDGLFGNSDDRGRKLADGYFSPWDIALTDRYAAFVAEGSPQGPQIYLVIDFAGTPTPVTSHFSPKSKLALEPSGRVFWVDSVFAPEAVFVRAP